MQARCIHQYVVLILTFGLSACLPGPGFFKQTNAIQPKAVETETGEAAGVEYASIKAGTTLTQEVTVSQGSPISGTTISFPPGALRIDTQIAIEEAASVATNLTGAELGIGENIASTGVSVAVQSQADLDTAQPFKLAIPLPSTIGLSLINRFDNLVVIYKVKKVSENAIAVGLIPRSEIVIENQTAVFETSHFGAFQVALTHEVIRERKEVKVETPILTKQEVEKLPPIAVMSRSTFVVRSKERIEIKGNNFRPTMMLALGGKKVNGLQVISDVQASFVAPENVGLGLTNLSVEQDGVSQTISMMYAGEANDYPIITLAATEVCSGQKYYDAKGQLQTGSKSCTGVDLSGIQPNQILTGVKIGTITGTLTPAPAACNTNGQTNCVTTSTYKSADLSNLSPSNIRSGVSIAGVSGDYPSVTHPLTANTATPDLLNFLTQLTSEGMFEFFDSAGNRLTGSGDGDLQPMNIKQGINFENFSLTGNYMGEPIEAWDIRKGIMANGMMGELKGKCRNRASTSLYNADTFPLPTTPVTSGTMVDWWDTIDDANGSTAALYPMDFVAAWGPETDCDKMVWEDLTADGSCDVATDDCMMRDRITQLIWSESYPSSASSPAMVTQSWPMAVQHCNNLNYGGYSDWRLPTQKELMTAYTHGIRHLAFQGTGVIRPSGDSLINNDMFLNLNGSAQPYWSATTDSAMGSYGWFSMLQNGKTSNVPKTNAMQVICVRSF